MSCQLHVLWEFGRTQWQKPDERILTVSLYVSVMSGKLIRQILADGLTLVSSLSHPFDRLGKLKEGTHLDIPLALHVILNFNLEPPPVNRSDMSQTA